ncbi:DegT/DnrJ/EryC1/StrS family aminotransferase [Nocardioides zeae]|uniref:DegT/DnrJ/EryC1/StrS family aminotransferase n=1 Tax=Nocardioides imazamoxiresistens TaxID=3231893 RepID=A0ABU3PTN1_9ACTN|nr:DegT/DnrJ/EryC1/StrS family aminotransferase [Nocardioides zeae]MDT9592549.1 DegT/DnrJ/EryC1/StrS family aminotransferase [Nocardioides zeae]
MTPPIPPTVPLMDLVAQHAEVADEVRAGVEDVMRRAAFVGGPEVRAFEEAYAQFVGARHCIGVANGTDALELALRAVGVGPGDEVVLPANTFVATAEAVSRIGAVPRPVDVDDERLLLDAEAVAAAVGPRTRAIVPVHLFGRVVPMEPVEAVAAAHGLRVVEDAAQAQGAHRAGRSAGALGDAAATSFYPGKNLGAAGDAGAVTTGDEEVAARVRLLAAHGSPRKYVHDVVGMNSRLDTVQAVVLSAKLRRLARWNELRREASRRYDALLADVAGVRLSPGDPEATDVQHLYVVRVPHRDRVWASLREAGVEAGVHYPTPVHLTGAYRHLGLGPGSFPVAERAAGEILSLPLFPQITEAQQERVAACLARALRDVGAASGSSAAAVAAR